MTHSQELEAARAQNTIYRDALERIVEVCTNSTEDDAEIRDYCFYQADAALGAARACRPEARWRRQGRQAAGAA